jgi:uncharacterized protein
MKLAVIGSGIAGLAAAHRLRAHASVTVFEAADYLGGHSNTVDVCLPDRQGNLASYGVDTGFLVFNERTYPGLIALFNDLNVATAASDMSFSVQVPEAGLGGRGLEWSGSSISSVFAQRGNLVRPKFWGMLQDLMRFNRICTSLATSGQEAQMRQSLRQFLNANKFGSAFCDWYLLPMLGCIWSCPPEQMLEFPVATMIRFCHNHGLLQISQRPQWWTVEGGSRQYVRKLALGLDVRLANPVERIERDDACVKVVSGGRAELFDAVVLAVHSDQALRLLDRPSARETAVLGAISYQRNRAILHTDVSQLPQRKSAWAAWNYERAVNREQGQAPVCLHYWLNRLQPLPFAQDIVVSLNPVRPIAQANILREFDYEHPVFDLAAIDAQAQVPALQGVQRTWFCGAWTGYGFHEDGLQSGYRAAQLLLESRRLRVAA